MRFDLSKTLGDILPWRLVWFRITLCSHDQSTVASVVDDALPRPRGSIERGLVLSRRLDCGLHSRSAAFPIQHLHSISELRAIFADNTRITDAGISQLPGLPLRWLGLNGTMISDASVPYLAKLEQLERLDVEETRLSEAGLVRLAQALPNCQISR
jgi:hypothetical protein